MPNPWIIKAIHLTRYFGIFMLVVLGLSMIVYFSNNRPGIEKLQKKKELIANKLSDKGHVGYLIISEKRIRWFNKLLPNSIKDSYHLKGMAVDYWILDLNNDGDWNEKDIDLMVKVIKEVEKEHPELKGWTATYLKKGTLARRMVHTDVRDR